MTGQAAMSEQGYGPVAAVAAARAAAEAVQELNRASRGPGGWVWPSQVYDTLGALVALTQALPQALDQAADWLGDALDADRLGHDQRPDRVEPTALVAIDALTHAQEHLRLLLDDLNDAHTYTAHLTGKPTSTTPRTNPRTTSQGSSGRSAGKARGQR